MENQTFTATDFSQEIGVHLTTVLRWIRSGKLHAEKNASNQWEIPAGEVDRIKRQAMEREVGLEVVKAASRSLGMRWRRGLVERMTELLIAAQRYRMDMWEWRQEEDPIQQQEILNRVMRKSFPDLLDKAAKAKQWHDFEELGTEMFKDVEARTARDEEAP
jgi:hypothetical protein